MCSAGLLFSFSLAPLLPRLLLWVSGFRGSCCLPCAAAWRAARISASLLVGCSRVSLRALRLLPCSGSGGFSVLAVFRFWVLTCWFLSCRFGLSFRFSFCLVELCIFSLRTVCQNQFLVKFGSNENFGLERGALHSLRDGHGVGSVELSGTRSAD